MWKGLLIVSALILAGAAYLGFENNKSFEILHKDRLNQQKLLADVKAKLESNIVALKTEVDATDQLVQEAEGLNTKLTVAKGKESDYKGQIEALTAQMSSANAMLKKGEDFMREVPDIEARKMQMAELQNQIQEEESATQNVQLQVAEVNTRRERLQSAATELQALVNDQNAGRIRGPFKSTVRKAFNNWGFVIVGAGNDQGVINRAQLDVTRRGQPICKLLVTTVEPGECVAEIIPGSMSPGQAIQPGDDVSKTNLPIPKSLPAAGAAPAKGDVPTPALPESAPGDATLPPAGELMPDAAPAAPAAAGMPAGADVDPFAPAKPAAPATPAKPDVDSDPFK
ncbi:MAG: hypothetical protein L3J39_14855 [Verrucomicrobiales bacterium]|nr:hypothetical protein [Verrucomicrobiales bacterium]